MIQTAYYVLRTIRYVIEKLASVNFLILKGIIIGEKSIVGSGFDMTKI